MFFSFIDYFIFTNDLSTYNYLKCFCLLTFHNTSCSVIFPHGADALAFSFILTISTFFPQAFMMELTAHQSSVGNVLQVGNQLIAQGNLSEEEEDEIREQMTLLNSRWETLRVNSMDRQARYKHTHTFTQCMFQISLSIHVSGRGIKGARTMNM